MSITANSFYEHRIKSHTCLIYAMLKVPEDSQSDCVVVAPQAGADRSEIECVSDDENEAQKPEEVPCLMKTMHKELEERKNPQSERSEGKKRQKELLM